MLRLTRWLSLCHKARDRVSGRILGNIYALHDEPLSVLDAVRFDASYLHLLEQCSRHENKAIRATAQGILYDIRRTPACVIYPRASNCWKNALAGNSASPLRRLSQKRPVSIRYRAKFHGTESKPSRKPGPDGLVSNQDQLLYVLYLQIFVIVLPRARTTHRRTGRRKFR